MKPQSKPARLLATFFLSMVTLACLCSLPSSLPEIIDQLGSSLTDEPPQSIDSPKEELDLNLSEETVGFVAPEMPGTTIPLETGGSIFVPEGALPQGTTINVYEIDDAPLLPEGIEPVAKALIISADVQPISPVLLRLPIPPEVTDPRNLVIVRIESDGRSTLLMPEVDGGDLLAYTPGFSKFILASFFQSFDVSLRGPHRLLPGQPATYSIVYKREATFGATWKITENGSLIQQSDIGATIQAGGNIGYLSLTVEFVDFLKGVRWFGGRYIEITQEPRFAVSLITSTPIIYAGDPVLIQADVHGEYTTPITYNWNFDDSGPGGSAVSTPGTTIINLPPRAFAARENVYLVRVIAQDAVGNKSSALVSIQVDRHSQVLKIEGEQFRTWAYPGVFGGYEASASGQDRAYRFNWMLKPGDQDVESTGFASNNQRATSKGGFMFTEPGEYLVEVVVHDVTEGETEVGKAILPVHVAGGNALDAHILSWPELIKPNDAVNFTFRAGGGTLVVGGQKGGYTVSIYWGDGTMNQESNVAIGQTGYQPIIFDLSHQWAEAGAYTVMLFVEDPTGAIAYAEAEIIVVDPVVVYEGYVTNSQGFLITNSDVEIKVSEDLVVATVGFTFEVDVKWDDQGVACKAILTRVYSGQTSRGTPIELILQLDSFTDNFEGSDCEDVSVPVIREQTLVGNINDDGNFQGNMRNVWFIYANRVSE